MWTDLKDSKWSCPAQGRDTEHGPALVAMQAASSASFPLHRLVSAVWFCGLTVEEARPKVPRVIPSYS